MRNDMEYGILNVSVCVMLILRPDRNSIRNTWTDSIESKGGFLASSHNQFSVTPGALTLELLKGLCLFVDEFVRTQVSAQESNNGELLDRPICCFQNRRF